MCITTAAKVLKIDGNKAIVELDGREALLEVWNKLQGEAVLPDKRIARNIYLLHTKGLFWCFYLWN